MIDVDLPVIAAAGQLLQNPVHVCVAVLHERLLKIGHGAADVAEMHHEDFSLLREGADVLHQVAELPALQPAADAHLHPQVGAVSRQLKGFFVALRIPDQAGNAAHLRHRRVVGVQSQAHVRLLTDGERPIQEIFEIVPDLLLGISPVVGHRPGIELVHVADHGLLPPGVLAHADAAAENAVGLPGDVVDLDAGLPQHSGKIIVFLNPLIPSRFSQMDFRAFLKGGAARVGDLQIVGSRPLRKSHHAVVVHRVREEIHRQVSDPHPADRLHLLVRHAAGAICLYFHHSIHS